MTDVAPSCELASTEARDGHCVTCGDIAVAMVVLRIDEARDLALCAAGSGEHETVETALVGPLAIGDEVLVHAGVALTRLGG